MVNEHNIVRIIRAEPYSPVSIVGRVQTVKTFIAGDTCRADG